MHWLIYSGIAFLTIMVLPAFATSVNYSLTISVVNDAFNDYQAQALTDDTNIKKVIIRWYTPDGTFEHADWSNCAGGCTFVIPSFSRANLTGLWTVQSLFIDDVLPEIDSLSEVEAFDSSNEHVVRNEISTFEVTKFAFVVPEFPVGPIAGVLAAIGALGAYIKFKR